MCRTFYPMATTTAAPSTQGNVEIPISASTHPQNQHNMNNNLRGGRGRGRGPRNQANINGGGHRGQAYRGNRAGGIHDQHIRPTSNETNSPAPPIPPPPGLGGGGSFGERLTKGADPQQGEGESKGPLNDQQVQADDVEAELCFICASPVVHNSVAPCNHRTCHICALRLRALYKTRACAHCRSEAKFVIFTDDASKRYEDFVDADFQQMDEVLGIKYEQKEIYDDTLVLLHYNCPDKSCDIACRGWPDLHRHVKGLHHKFLCDLCTRNKKVFTHEHELFTQQELRKHEKFGDDNPGAVDQSGFKGHPECGFCRQRFYGDDELYVHCREKHEKCHICDRRNPARQQQYFVDYNSLEQHFSKDHYLCSDRECMDKKFVVFESEMDLKAHQLEAHPLGLSKDARRDARRVDISGFDYRAPHQNDRGGRRDPERRARGPGRDPNVEALPHSSAQPLRRDELAFQRQMAIQSAQSTAPRTFGAQLTSTETSSARPAAAPQRTVTVNRDDAAPTTNDSLPSIDHLHIDSTGNTQPTSPRVAPAMTPQEQARKLQHSAVVDRASSMLKHDQSKISDFRNRVSSYRTSTISASQLIDSFFSLFDVPSSDLGKLIKELAEIYENEAKRNGLLKAWNDWRAVNEDYPSLPGPSGAQSGPSAPAAGGGGGLRVLRLKSSTAQSSRSAVNQKGSWGNAASSNPFPPTPAASVNRIGPGRVGAVPWVASSSASSSSRSSPAPSQPALRPPTSSSSNKTNSSASDAFPALPITAKPNTTILGLTRGTVKPGWGSAGNVGNPTNPWGGISGSASADAAAAAASVGMEANDGEAQEAMKKKGKKNQKQTLYRFG